MPSASRVRIPPSPSPSPSPTPSPTPGPGPRVEPVRGTDRSRFRADIEGLRAIAVLSVMLWHGGVPGIGGGFVGVDIFFVISGFLMTSLLFGDAMRLDRVRILAFYARRIRRLLPAAAAALVGAALITVLVLPPIRWARSAGDIAAAALYVVNWRFANSAADYLQQDSASSVVLHFWSLSVEEQFYLVLPLLLALVCLVVATRRRRRVIAGTLLLAAGMVSFVFCVHDTAADPARAYYVSTTRVWELALGGVIAVGAPLRRRLPAAAATVLSWLGLAAVLTAIFAFSSRTVFPGSAAALPTLGTAAVLAAGIGPTGPGAVLALRQRPLQWVGARSYSLYLWHWPLLVGAKVLFGDRNGNLPAVVALAVLASSVIPAWLSFRFVEERWRRPRPLVQPRHRSAEAGGAAVGPAGRGAVVLVVACSAISLLASTGVRVDLARENSSDVATATTRTTSGARVALGARVLAADPDGDPHGAPVDTVPFMTPSAVQAPDDLPVVYADGCHLNVQTVAARSCILGDPSGHYTVAVVGDSHAAQWIPALQVIARQRHWKLVTYTKSACPFNPSLVGQHNGKPYTECRTWVANVLSALARLKPKLVVTSAADDYQVLGANDRPLSAAASRTAMVDGFRSVWTTLTGRHVRVEVIADTPWAGFNVPDCVSQQPGHLRQCAFGRDAQRLDPLKLAMASPIHGTGLINLDTAICPATRCAPVIGDVLIYRDDSHITKSYILTLAPRLAAALAPAVGTGG